MSRDAKTQPGLADSAQIGGFQIFLSEMHAIGLVLNRQLPVIVNEQSGVIAAPGVLATGVGSIAVVSAITQAADWRAATNQLLTLAGAGDE